MYTYQFYGLTVFSDMPLPELIAGKQANSLSPDVRIYRDTVSEYGLTDGKKLGPFLQTTPDQLWLTVPDVARFLIRRGREIIYHPLSNADEDSIRVFMLGSCIGALLFQRGFLVLHGNAFEVEDGCVICVGQSGAGKSTLAAEMMRRGYRIISDDVCPLDAAGNAIPGMPRIKLWQDSADKLGIDTSGLRRIRPWLEKFNYPLHEQYCNTPLPVKSVYILNSHNENCFDIERIQGMDKFVPLKQNTYRYGYLKGMNLSQQHLRQCGQLATQIQLARIRRPRGSFQLEALADFILDDVCQQAIA